MTTAATRAFRADLFEHFRPKVSCWYHFDPRFREPAAACDAHVRHFETFDLDFLKVMYEFGYPRDGLGADGVVQSVADLRKLRPVAGDGPPFDQQLELLRRLRTRLGPEVPLTTTIFHTWMELRNLVQPPRSHHHPPTIEMERDEPGERLTEFLRADRSAVEAALQAIGATLADFARACMKAGADGIYLATRSDWVETPANHAALGLPPDGSVYDQLVTPSDRAILAGAAEGWFNFVHLCGTPQCLERHVGNPHVHVLHWADRVAGPSLGVGRQVVEATLGTDGANRLALAAGVDNQTTLPRRRPLDVIQEVWLALTAGAGRPLIIAPGCTYDPEAVPEENIHAMVAAAHS